MYNLGMTLIDTEKEVAEFEKYKKSHEMVAEPENYIHMGLDPSYQFSDFRKEIKGLILKANTLHSQKIEEAIAEGERREREKCRAIFITKPDWAEWGMSDEDANEVFDEALKSIKEATNINK